MAAPPLPRVLVPHPHVRVDAQILSGSPHVVGSRVPVRRLWAWHRGGTAIETLFRRYPNLGQAKILDALSFAYDNMEIIQADLEREQVLFDQEGKKESERTTAEPARASFFRRLSSGETRTPATLNSGCAGRAP